MSRQHLTIPVIDPATGTAPLEVWDQLILTGAGPLRSGRSPGILVITDLAPALTPMTINSAYELISVSAQAYLGLYAGDGSGNNIGHVSGRLGSIQTGIFYEDEVVTPINSGASITPNGTNTVFLPKDNTLTTTLWDTVTGEMPPIFDEPSGPGPRPALNTLLPVWASISPPNPIQIYPVIKTYAGIWINQSIFSQPSTGPYSMGLFLRAPSFTVDYDDGL